ncbi:tyrosine-protein kinase [Streptococcus sp. X16XC17]|uniref:tyrosine-protein kinase n=1 Tax=unclassified Streptococcus TaxID=2608887 RepID=UPI00066FF379|nr:MULTISPECIES: tyrosine-protein kinase [unclassified Streptococcus]TCD46259.1 tyrosine-protein kinase [Streptococcus sp. X16XC17]
MIKMEIVKSKYDELKTLHEYYNSIITNVQFSGRDLKKIVVTSVQPNEGKTTTSINMAITFAEAGYKTLLIDADTRNSIMSGIFRASERFEGLTSFLTGNAQLPDVVHETSVSNLMVVPSGKMSPNPTNLLQNSQFNYMMDNLSNIFDYIIVDTAPIGLVIDAAIIAKKCDASLIVTAAGTTKRRFVQKAKEQMEQSDAQFLGVILNKVDLRKENYGSYDGYGAYGAYGKQKHSKVRRRK